MTALAVFTPEPDAVTDAGFVWSDFLGEKGGWSRTVGENEQIITMERTERWTRFTAYVIRIEDCETLSSVSVTTWADATAALPA